MTPPMTGPTTQAGKALLKRGATNHFTYADIEAAILAIEAEARADADRATAVLMSSVARLYRRALAVLLDTALVAAEIEARIRAASDPAPIFGNTGCCR